MKYNFVYDEGFLENSSYELSSEEISVVLATVVGKHNAIFYGYKPERLVKAIKRLSYKFIEVENNCSRERLLGGGVYATCYADEAKNGILFVKGVGRYDFDFQLDLALCSDNHDTRYFQLVATTEVTPATVLMSRRLLDNFDIVYKCKDNIRYIQPYNKLLERKERAEKFRGGLISGRYTTALFAEIDGYWNFGSFMKAYNKLLEEKGAVIAKKLAKVARSISDIKDHQMTSYEDLMIAKNWYDEGGLND
jgi:hypothetical protein